MTYDVVVLIEREMSEGDARRVAALHARREDTVDYHLLVSSHPESGFGGPMALLGSTFADVAGLTGSASVVGSATVASARVSPPATVDRAQSRTQRGTLRGTLREPQSGTPTATLADPAVDLASVIEHSSRRLRAASGYPVHVSITHGEVLLALMQMVKTTACQEVVVVAWPETAAAFVCSDWTTKARRILKVPRVRILEHDT
jgi:oxalate decarboxylase/phosphoglucose isomerase-like protein (cupin superfamily)